MHDVEVHMLDTESDHREQWTPRLRQLGGQPRQWVYTSASKNRVPAKAREASRTCTTSTAQMADPKSVVMTPQQQGLAQEFPIASHL